LDDLQAIAMIKRYHTGDETMDEAELEAPQAAQRG